MWEPGASWGWRLRKGAASEVCRRQLVLFSAEILGTPEATGLKCPQLATSPGSLQSSGSLLGRIPTSSPLPVLS